MYATVPPRRYADMVVHRQLVAALAGAREPPVPHGALSSAAHTMNERHRAAKAAQKARGRGGGRRGKNNKTIIP
jgi:DIS3-like exonuclease 1